MSAVQSARHLRASAIVLYRLQPQLELFVVRRSEKLRAFPGAWTFPGGRWDPGDGALDDQSMQEQPADRHTALRELVEETLFLPGFGGDHEALQRSRQALLSDAIDWPTFCQKLNYSPPVERLLSLGLRMSPPITPRRFLTWYFLLEASELPEQADLSDELVAGEWQAPRHLLTAWEQGNAVVPPPVLGILRALVQAQDPRQELDALRGLGNSETELYGEMEIFPGIEMLPLRTPTLPPATHTNCWMIGKERFVIIDPACPDPQEQALLWQRIQRRLADGERPEAILLTHHHRDHIGAVRFLQDKLSLPVGAHPWTAERLAPEIQVNIPIEDGFVWELGQDPYTQQDWRLEAIFTPGHAPGHLCFLDHRHRIAVVGDMLAGFGTILIKRPHGDMAVYLASLRRLIDLDLKHALPAHGPLILKPSAYCEYYIQHRLKREAKITRALEAEGLDLQSLLERVYADTDRRAWPLARLSLEAHLHKLETEGRVQLQGTQWSLLSQ